MITVHTADGEAIAFDGASGYSTDEHNNLCIASTRKGMLLAVFAEGHWLQVRLDDGAERTD